MLQQADPGTPLWAIGKITGMLQFDARKVRAGGQLEIQATRRQRGLPPYSASQIDPADMDELTRRWWAFRSSVRLFGPSAPGRDRTQNAFGVIDELQANGEISDALHNELRTLISDVAGYEFIHGRKEGQGIRNDK